MDKKIDVKIEKLKNSEVEITGAIPFEELEKHRAESMKRLGENISVDGFRKGHVPEKVIVEKVGEMSILNEMAEKALQASYLDILLINKIDAVTSPEITITKLAPNNPLEFKIKVAVMPEIKLPDYKKIALKENSKKEEHRNKDGRKNRSNRGRNRKNNRASYKKPKTYQTRTC